jgi:signal transduction histidine kinase
LLLDIRPCYILECFLLRHTTLNFPLFRAQKGNSYHCEEKFKPVDLAAVIKESLYYLRSSIPAAVRISEDLSSECPLILGDPTQLHQVMIKLCTNATHAMADKGGELSIVVRELVIDAAKARLAEGLQNGRYVQLTIRDTGHGIPLGLIEWIFDSFFSTREVGQGSGMGLAVVHGVIKSHGGMVTVSSWPGQGAAFHLFFPVIEPHAKLFISRSAGKLDGQRTYFVCR